MQEKTFYVNNEGFATIVCPVCGHAKKLDTRKLPPDKKRLTVQCKCGERFHAHIEYRKQYRKFVNLPGSYENLSRDGDSGKIIVDDISMGGVGFHTVRIHDIISGDKLLLEFTLDTTPPREISRHVKVLRVSGRNIGSAYIHQAERDRDIGLYLMA